MRLTELALALGVSLFAMVPALAEPAAPMMGGLRLQIAGEGPMKGLLDASPLARSEVALRADPRTRAVVIAPWGWRLTLARSAALTGYLADACTILRRNGIPSSAIVEVSDGAGAAMKRRCSAIR